MFGAQQDKLRPSEEKNHCCYMSLFLWNVFGYVYFFTRNLFWEGEGHFQCVNLARAVLWIVWSEKKEGEKGKEEKFQPVFKTEHVPDRSK